MVDAYYNVNGRMTAYEALPSYIKTNIAKSEAMQKTASGYPVAAYEAVARDRSPARAQLAERERLYQQGEKHLPTLTLAYGGGNIRPTWADKPGASKYERYRQAAKQTYKTEVPIGTVGTTWDERFPAQFVVTTPDGKVRTFDSSKAAEKYASRYGTPVPQESNPLIGAPAPTYEYVTTKGETKSFRTEKEALAFAEKDQGDFVGVIKGLEYYREKPVSPTGERLELIGNFLETQQKQAASQGYVGIPATLGYEIGKDIVGGAGAVENLLWQADAYVRNGTTRYRETKTPVTATSIIVTNIVERKPVKKTFGDLATYEKTYGRGTTVAGLAGLLIPIPGAKGVNLVAPITRSPKLLKVASVVGEKIRVPKVKNLISETSDVITTSKQKRIVKKYAQERIAEGTFGVRKMGKNVWAIERGVEEVRKDVTPGVKPKIIGWTEYIKEKVPVKIPAPIYSKAPKKQIMPQPGKVAQVPLTIVEFKKEYVKTGKTFTEKSEPFIRTGQKIPPLKKVKSTPRIKKFSIAKSMGLNLTLRKPQNLRSSFVKSFGIVSPKRARPKSRTVEVTEVTDYLAPQEGMYQTVGTKRVLVTSADPDFVRQTNQLRLRQISPFSYQGKMSKELVEAEQVGLVRLTAVGKTIPLKIARSGDLEKMQEFIGKKAYLTKVFETSQGGLGRAKEFPFQQRFFGKAKGTGGLVNISKIEKAPKTIDRFEGVGSSDFERKLTAVGLGEKRIYYPPKTPFSFGGETTSAGTGTGKARSLSEETKKQILSSYEEKAKAINDAELKITGGMTKTEKKFYYKNIAKERRIVLDRLYPSTIVKTKKKEEPTDYLQVKSSYRIKEKSQEELYNMQGQGNFNVEDEEIIIRYPERIKYEATPRLTTTGITKVSQQLGTSQGLILRTEQRSVLLQKQKTQQILDANLITKREMLMRGKTEFDVTPAFRVFPITTPRTGTLLTPRVVTLITPRIDTKLIQEPVIKITTEPRPRITTKKFPPGLPPALINAKRRTRRSKSKIKYAADFLGASSEYSVFGFTGRSDITYGRLRTAKATERDFRKRLRAPAYVNPESVKLRQQRKKETPDWMREEKRRRSTITTNKALFGKTKRVKF